MKSTSILIVIMPVSLSLHGGYFAEKVGQAAEEATENVAQLKQNVSQKIEQTKASINRKITALKNKIIPTSRKVLKEADALFEKIDNNMNNDVQLKKIILDYASARKGSVQYKALEMVEAQIRDASQAITVRVREINEDIAMLQEDLEKDSKKVDMGVVSNKDIENRKVQIQELIKARDAAVKEYKFGLDVTSFIEDRKKF